MPTSDLQRWLTDLPGFRRQLNALTIDSVLGQFPALQTEIQSPKHDWQYLLLCASILASARQERSQDAALRIAHHCLVASDTSTAHRDAAAVILDSLTNKPAIRLAEERQLLEVNVLKRLPRPLQQDMVRRSLENAVTLSSGSTFFVNRFQREFWHLAKNYDWLSVSAPTSAGKSYILKRWLEQQVRNSPLLNIVYLVPTRALIQEVEDDLRLYFKKATLNNVAILSILSAALVRPGMSHIFVFTQERYHLFMTKVLPSFRTDILLVDEAQKIGDGHRGVLLQQVIDESVARNPQARVIFASPLTTNPEVLLMDAPADRTRQPLLAEQVTVNQNLLWVSQVPRNPQKWQVSLFLDESPQVLGSVLLKHSPSHTSKRLTFVAHALSHKEGGNLIYVNSAGEAEKVAAQLYELVEEDGNGSVSQEVKELAELIRETIHPKYSLAKVIHRGIGFHYGNMPLLVRREIEDLFRKNILRYLICTSTLLEGVNLPCRSVFARGPQKGRGHPMSPSDFWNLAGRAGRWGTEFQGNVVCIDPRPDVWRNGIPNRRVKQTIIPTTDRLETLGDKLLEFILTGSPRATAIAQPELEYLFSYLAGSYIRHGSLRSTPLAERINKQLLLRLDEAVEQVIKSLATPAEIVLRNPGISPIAMDSLLNYFRDYQKPIDELLPAPPESDDATTAYTRIFYRFNAHLADEFGRGGRVVQCALLVVNWMRGYPLSRIIGEWLSFLDRNERPYDLAAEIRSTMEDIETIARYAAPKYLACYIDILLHHMRVTGIKEPEKMFSDLGVLLEFGVSQKTQLSLMALGVSRTSAIAVSELIARDDMSVEEVATWLRSQDLEAISLPALVKRDIQRALDLVNPK